MKTQLTQEEKRIRIAEACGIEVEPCTCTANPFRDAKTKKHLPDYFGDLNKCAEMERTMTDDQRFAYDKKLQIVLLEGAKCQEDYWLISAKAEFRAEAFGLTLGLW